MPRKDGASRAHVTIFIDKNINTKRRANIRPERDLLCRRRRFAFEADVPRTH